MNIKRYLFACFIISLVFTNLAGYCQDSQLLESKYASFNDFFTKLTDLQKNAYLSYLYQCAITLEKYSHDSVLTKYNFPEIKKNLSQNVSNTRDILSALLQLRQVYNSLEAQSKILNKTSEINMSQNPLGTITSLTWGSGSPPSEIVEDQSYIVKISFSYTPTNGIIEKDGTGPWPYIAKLLEDDLIKNDLIDTKTGNVPSTSKSATVNVTFASKILYLYKDAIASDHIELMSEVEIEDWSTNSKKSIVKSIPVIETHTLDIFYSPSNSAGSVTKDPVATKYRDKTTIRLTASPSTGYLFDKWSQDLTGSTNPITFKITKDTKVTANFKLKQYTLTVISSPTNGGSVSKNPNKSLYNYGESVTLTATPNTGYLFDRWGIVVDGSATTQYIINTNPIIYKVTGNTTITAYFKIKQYTLSVTLSPINGGSVSKIPDKSLYNYGESVKLTPTPNSGFEFDYWSGSISGTSNPKTIIMDGNKSIIANFKITKGNLSINVYNVPGASTALPGNNGTVELYNSSGNLVDTKPTVNGVASFSNITPGSGYYLKAYHNGGTIFGKEYWGQSSSFTVKLGSNSQTFTRNMPYSLKIHVYNKTTGAEVTGGTVLFGTQLEFKTEVMNTNPNTQTVRGIVALDRNKSGDDGYDYYQYSNSKSAAGNNKNTTVDGYSLVSSLSAGTYYTAYATQTNVSSSYLCTDGTAWFTNPVVIIKNKPVASFYNTGNIPSTIRVGETCEIVADYTDFDGASDLHFAYLRIVHPTIGSIELEYDVSLKKISYLSTTYISKPSVIVSNIANGCTIKWYFYLKSSLPRTTNGLNFQIKAKDFSGLQSDLTSANKSISFSDPIYGVTIITHGFKATGSLSDIDWARAMGRAIGKRLGNAIVRQLNPESGLFEIKDSSRDIFKNGVQGIYPTNDWEEVLIMDWRTESDLINVFTRGFSEAAADAFVAAILKLQLDNKEHLFLDNIHLIGHSRGCVVNSEMVERLLYWKNNYSKEKFKFNGSIGNSIYVTYLDPHPTGLGPGDIDYPNSDWVNNDSTLPNQIIAWPGISKSDAYYQTLNKPVFFGLIHLNGTYVKGSYSYNLNECFKDSSTAHSLVHTWYYGTINPDDIFDDKLSKNNQNTITGEEQYYQQIFGTITRNWYKDKLGLIQGFAYSPHGGNNIHDISKSPNDILLIEYNYDTDALFNGNFKYNSLLGIPGWEHQGGGGSGKVESDKYLTFIFSGGNIDIYHKHNWLYLSNRAKEIKFNFDAYITNSSKVDLTVKLGNNIIKIISINSGTSSQSVNIPINDNNLKGYVYQLIFAIKGATPYTTSNIKIYNVQVVVDNNIILVREQSKNTLENIPKYYCLNQNYPNPFNSSTIIQYELPQASMVTVKVYNMLGEEIKTLVDTYQYTGKYKILWNGLNNTNILVGGGVYIYRITAGSYIDSKRMILIK